jgi:hypothetical protein
MRATVTSCCRPGRLTVRASARKSVTFCVERLPAWRSVSLPDSYGLSGSHFSHTTTVTNRYELTQLVAHVAESKITVNIRIYTVCPFPADPIQDRWREIPGRRCVACACTL